MTPFAMFDFLPPAAPAGPTPGEEPCPRCGQRTLIRMEGRRARIECQTCRLCVTRDADFHRPRPVKRADHH